MSEPRKPILCARVSTAALERAVSRLPLNRYPLRLAVIDQELKRRVLEREAAEHASIAARRAQWKGAA